MTAAELAIVISARDRASSGLRKLNTNVKTVGKSIGTMNKAATRIGSVLGVGATGLGLLAAKTGVQFNILKENATLAFTTLLKDGGKAQAMIAQIEETAKKTPFGFEDLTRASQRLLAFGFAGEDVIPILTTVGDAVSAMGGGAEMIDRVTMALGQMQTKGKVSGEEMMQLAEAGIPAWAILAENVELISPALAAAAKAGKLTQEQVIQRLQKMGEAGKLKAGPAIAALRKGMAARFGGLGEKQAKTTAGATSALSDALKELFGALSEGPLKTITGWMITLAEEVPKITKAFKDLAQPVQDVIGWLAAAALAIGTTVIAIGGASGILGVLGVGSGLAGVLGGLGAFLASAASPFAILAAAVVIAKLAWDRNFQPILDAVALYMATFPHVKIALSWANDQAKAVADWIMDLGKPLSAAVKVAVQWANDAARDLAAWANSAAKSITQTVSVAVSWASGLGATIGGWIAGGGITRSVTIAVAWAMGLGTAIGGWLADGSAITRSITVAASWATGLATTIGAWLSGGGAITRSVATALTWSGDLAMDIGRWLQGSDVAVVRKVGTALTWAGELATAIGEWLADDQTHLGRIASVTLAWGGEIAGSIGDWFAGKGEALTRNVQAFLSWGGEIGGAIGDWFAGTGSALSRNVEAVLSWGGELAGSLGDWFAGNGEALGRNVSTYLYWAGDLAAALGDWFAGKGEAIGRNISAHLGWAGDLAAKIGGWVASGGSLMRVLTLDFQWLSESARKIYEWWTGSGGTIPGGGGRVVNVGMGGQVPFMAAGGTMATDGLAYLHAGETVTPAGGGGGMISITINTPAIIGVNQLEDVIVGALDRARRRGRIA